MNPTLVVTTVTNVLGLIEEMLPLIGGSNSSAIGNVIKTLTDLAPLVTDQIGATYTGVRNIIDSIGAHPATTDEQVTALDAFSKTVDDAWDAIEGKLDPDAPATT
jgi:hypothetical protein